MNQTADRLVNTYLDDLARMLDQLDPAERAEVLEGVREHITSALEGHVDVTERDVRAVLAELGPASTVAEEAYAARPGGPTRGTPWASRAWVPPVVTIAMGLMLVFAAVAISGLSAYSSSSSCTSNGGCTQEALTFTGVLGPTLATFLVMSWLWLPTSALVAASTLWTRTEKWVLVLLVPGLLLGFAILVEAGWALTRSEVGINVSAWFGLTLIIVGGGLALWRLNRRPRA